MEIHVLKMPVSVLQNVDTENATTKKAQCGFYKIITFYFLVYPFSCSEALSKSCYCRTAILSIGTAISSTGIFWYRYFSVPKLSSIGIFSGNIFQDISPLVLW